LVRAQSPRDSSPTGAISTVLFFGLLIPLAATRAQTRAAVTRFRGLENGVASVGISEGRL